MDSGFPDGVAETPVPQPCKMTGHPSSTVSCFADNVKYWCFSLSVKSAIKKMSAFLPLNETDKSVQTGESVLYSR